MDTNSIVLLAMSSALAMSVWRPTPPDPAARLRSIERKLDALVKHLGVQLPPDTHVDEIQALLRGGNKIAAIKVWRAETHAGLAEAKAEVERIQREMVAKEP